MARIIFIVDSDFEDSEFRVPYEQVRQAGHEAVIVGLEAGKRLKGKKGQESITTEKSIYGISGSEFDALVIPGGYSPDHLRMEPRMVNLVRSFFESGRPIAAICHAGSLLAEADIVQDRTVTSWPSIRTDLINAGAHWVDRAVVEDGNLITSRKPEDLKAFCGALLRQVEQGASSRVGQPLEPEQPSVH